jgi:hypothetical protein
LSTQRSLNPSERFPPGQPKTTELTTHARLKKLTLAAKVKPTAGGGIHDAVHLDRSDKLRNRAFPGGRASSHAWVASPATRISARGVASTRLRCSGAKSDRRYRGGPLLARQGPKDHRCHLATRGVEAMHVLQRASASAAARRVPLHRR